ncbi:MAG: hypothetical protein AAGI01_06240 [Myxococcota bacterium]
MIHPRTLLVPSIAGAAVIGLFAAAVVASVSESHVSEPEVVFVQDAAETGVEIWSAETFPRAFEGTFTWDLDHAQISAQHIRYEVGAVQEREGVLIATGRGETSYTHYPCEPAVTFDFRVEVDQSTGAFEMWESSPSIEENYITEGKYVSDLSTLAGNFDTIHVKWKGDNGEDGRLVLTGLDGANPSRTSP